MRYQTGFVQFSHASVHVGVTGGAVRPTFHFFNVVLVDFRPGPSDLRADVVAFLLVVIFDVKMG